MDCDGSKNPSHLRASRAEAKSCDRFVLASITLYIIYLFLFLIFFKKVINPSQSILRACGCRAKSVTQIGHNSSQSVTLFSNQ